jgi:hypothetical protein
VKWPLFSFQFLFQTVKWIISPYYMPRPYHVRVPSKCQHNRKCAFHTSLSSHIETNHHRSLHTQQNENKERAILPITNPLSSLSLDPSTHTQIFHGFFALPSHFMAHPKKSSFAIFLHLLLDAEQMFCQRMSWLSNCVVVVVYWEEREGSTAWRQEWENLFASVWCVGSVHSLERDRKESHEANVT